jgi:hypothetical protein
MDLRVDGSVGKIVGFTNIVDFFVEMFVADRECGVVYLVVIALCFCSVSWDSVVFCFFFVIMVLFSYLIL